MDRGSEDGRDGEGALDAPRNELIPDGDAPKTATPTSEPDAPATPSPVATPTKPDASILRAGPSAARLPPRPAGGVPRPDAAASRRVMRPLGAPKHTPAATARGGAATTATAAAAAPATTPGASEQPRELSETRARAQPLDAASASVDESPAPRAPEAATATVHDATAGASPEALEVEVDLEPARPPRPDLPEEDTGAIHVRRSISSAPVVAKLGRFELIGRVAAGGMAEIYLAREQMAAGQSRSVALKLVRPVFLENQSFEELFVSEGRVGLQLAHPHICHVYEFGKTTDRYFIAMEWIDGVTLLDLCKRSRDVGLAIPVAVYVRIAADVAGALHFAHRLRDRRGKRIGVVHRDVSPQNIMISYEGAVKLLDFGVAKERNDGEATSSGTMKGKLGYMSPEQARAQPVDGRSDLFGLAVCLFEALTGKALHRRANQYDTMRAIMEFAPPPLAGTAPDMTDSLDRIFERALAKNPADRYKTAGEMQEALEQYLVDTRTVVTATRVSRLLETLFADEMARGPQIEATTLAVDLGSAPVQVLGEGSGSDPADMPLRRKDSTGNIDLEHERIAPPLSASDVTPSPVVPPTRRHRWLTPVIVLGAVALLVAAALAFWTHPTPQTAAPPPPVARTPEPAETPVLGTPEQGTTGTEPAQAATGTTGETGVPTAPSGEPGQSDEAGETGATAETGQAAAAPMPGTETTPTVGPTGRRRTGASQRRTPGGFVSDPGF